MLRHVSRNVMLQRIKIHGQYLLKLEIVILFVFNFILKLVLKVNTFKLSSN